MDWLTVAVVVLTQAMLAVFVVTRTKAGRISSRLLTLEHIAEKAAGVGAQLGANHEDKRQHALSAARQMDEADNGRRDYTDAELRIAIEAHLGNQQ